MTRTILAAAMVSLFAGSALAADMPARMPVKAAPMAVPYYNWTGFYVGLNAGYGWARTDDIAAGVSANPRGFVGGGQIGYNWQVNQVVFGLEADFQGSGQRESASGVLPAPFGFTTVTDRVRYFGTIRGRVGYAWDRALLYVTGGYAYQNIGIDVTAAGGSASSSTTKGGYTLGGGLEYAFAGPWTAGLEYLYLDSGTTTTTLFGAPFQSRVRNNVLRAKVNYRF